jgi:phosphoribosylpyrophosphate synthetase
VKVIRRLNGITYWVIDDPDSIYDFVNSEIRREWETDAINERRNPKDDPWLRTLPRRKWHLRITDIAKIKLNPVRDLLRGKKVVVVEDSIVRGTTSRTRIKALREAGAKEIHMRISCPLIDGPLQL